MNSAQIPEEVINSSPSKSTPGKEGPAHPSPAKDVRPQDKVWSLKEDFLLIRTNSHLFDLHAEGSFEKGHEVERIVAHRKTEEGMEFIVQWKEKGEGRPLPTKLGFETLKQRIPGQLLEYIGTHMF